MVWDYAEANPFADAGGSLGAALEKGAMYRAQSAEFPPECKGGDYEQRLQAAYPIHPEIFDRLCADWSTLAKFQRTRGVLRLMAAVIHSLWEKGDRNPLILPSAIPIDDARVQFELTRYLSDNWAPILEKDVDGPHSLPLKLDAEQPNLGKLHATRRVARTIYLGSAPTSAAAQAILETRGNMPRLYRNTLVFLAADKVRRQDLDEALRQYLAWTSILAEKEPLNLDPHQARQAETQQQAADGAVTARLPETYQWLLAPVQVNPQAPITWQAIRLSGSDALAVRASKKLRHDELLLASPGATILRRHLDDAPLWRGDHVAIRQLVEDFARYLYLPRLQTTAVLTGAIQDGLKLLTWEQDAFAYAESYDEAAGLTNRPAPVLVGQRSTTALIHR